MELVKNAGGGPHPGGDPTPENLIQTGCIRAQESEILMSTLKVALMRRLGGHIWENTSRWVMGWKARGDVLGETGQHLE